jgi:hypothetical protein
MQMALMTSLKEYLYCAVLHEMVVLLKYEWTSKFVIVDFEKSLLNAVKYEFKGCLVRIKVIWAREQALAQEWARGFYFKFSSKSTSFYKCNPQDFNTKSQRYKERRPKCRLVSNPPAISVITLRFIVHRQLLSTPTVMCSKDQSR